MSRGLNTIFKILVINIRPIRKFKISLLLKKGGIYIFQLMDFYSASGMPLLWTCFFQTIAIGWIFGTDKFCDCVAEMTGKKPGLFWFLCWKYLAPSVMFVSNLIETT